MNKGVKDISLREMLPLIEEKISLGGDVIIKPQGLSMLPLIRPGKDRVVVSRAILPLNKYDLPLYKRKDGSFVIHRVVGFGENETYIMRGDNQTQAEKGITDNDIIGLVTEIYKGRKPIRVSSFGYKFYVLLVVVVHPLRRVIKWCLGKCKIIR